MIKIQTEVGELDCTPTDGEHLYVTAEKGVVGSHSIPYHFSAHLFLKKDGTGLEERQNNGIRTYYVRRADQAKVDPSKSAIRYIVDRILPVLNAWVITDEAKKAFIAAKHHSLLTDLNRVQSKMKEAAAALETLQTEQANIVFKIMEAKIDINIVRDQTIFVRYWRSDNTED